MKGGQNRKPRSVKEAQNTLQKCRDNPAAPKVEPGKVPPPPKGLSALQKAVWAELAGQVEYLGVFAPSHVTAFRLMVEVVAQTRKFDTRDPPSAVVRLQQVASSLLQRFGLDPVSQERVSVAPKPKEGSAESFLFGGRPKVIDGGKTG